MRIRGINKRLVEHMHSVSQLVGPHALLSSLVRELEAGKIAVSWYLAVSCLPLKYSWICEGWKQCFGEADT